MNYFKIDMEDTCNGLGMRTVLWVSGCAHNCEGCQNPETWDATHGTVFNEQAETQLFKAIDKTPIKGLTLSGGDPLYIDNLIPVKDLLYKFRSRYSQSKDIWLYTGYTWEDIFYTPMQKSELSQDEINRLCIASMCDVIVDGPFILSQRDITLPFRGSCNQRIIDVKKSLANKDIVCIEI